jgi:TPR repeat protein
VVDYSNFTIVIKKARPVARTIERLDGRSVRDGSFRDGRRARRTGATGCEELRPFARMPSSRDRLRNLRMGTEAGVAAAQCELGISYYMDAVSPNHSEAARLFHLAADQGHAQAQCVLAGCYMLGQGVPGDMGEGVRLMTLAAEQGYAPAQIGLAGMNRRDGGSAVAVPRGAARKIAQAAQSPKTREGALALLGECADDRTVARTCCIGCGKTEQLQVCAKCLTAKFCSRECQRRMWPAHKPACKAWREQKAAAAAEAGGASSSEQAESGTALAGR